MHAGAVTCFCAAVAVASAGTPLAAQTRAQQVWHPWFAVDTRETPYVGDFDGDGRTDIITFTRDNPSAFGDVYVALSNGHEFVDRNGTAGLSDKWNDWFAISHDETVVIGDFDGDGDDDIATWLGSSTRQVYVALSYGAGMTPAQVWLDSIGVDPSDVILSGDVNGDGRKDLVLFARRQGTVYVALSNGAKFLEPAPWHGFFAVSTYERPRVADVNGDGKADIVTFATDSPTAFGDVYVALSDGTRFLDQDGVPNNSTKWHDWFAIRPEEEVRIGDLNGDRRDDFFTFLPPPWGQCYSVASQGTAMGPNVLWPEIVTPDANDEAFVGDANGDGSADAIVFAQSEGKVYVSPAPAVFQPLPPVTPVVSTSDDGNTLVLQTRTATEIVRVGLQKSWGGAITEVSLNGTDYVNNDDPGREIQVSLWDANHPGGWGYNPVEAGDHFYHGSPVLASAVAADSIYVKTQPLEWAPEAVGGGWNSPVLGDAYIEKWISVVPGYNRVFRVHYRITHFGSDSHGDAFQELPVMYVNPNVPRFLYYGGNAPWTNDALSEHVMPSVCCDMLHTPEKWGAYVDANATGIALYTPGQYPNSKGFDAGSTLQFTPMCPVSWAPGAVLDFDTFILVGNVYDSRAAIYALRREQPRQSPLPAAGFAGVDGGAILSGTATVSGWAWALSHVTSVDVFVDGNRVGSATYGLERPDVPAAFPGAPSAVGFQYPLDTTRFPNGTHTIVSKATDGAGHVATFATSQVSFSN
jgi:hypothetical protein